MNNHLIPQEFTNDFKNNNCNNIKKKFLKHIYQDNLILNKTDYKDVIDIFLSNLIDGNKLYKKNKNNIISNISFIDNDVDLQQKDNTFFPDSIQKYIETNISTIYSYKFNIFHRKIHVNFCFFDSITNTINEDILKIYLLLYIVSLYSNKNCSEEMLINIYFTPFCKEFPNDDELILDRININSAWTYRCKKHNSITIYRKEEWLKVLCHEVIHSFGLDFDISDEGVKICKKIFNINSDYLIGESYCEFLAIVFNSLLYVYTDMNSDKKNIYNNFCNIIKKEKQFALFQLVKIFSYMDTSYINIMNNNDVEKYKEKTNVFCYYIIKTILLINDTDTIEHFIQYNKNIINFDEKNISKFIKYIAHKSKQPEFITAIKKMEYNTQLNYNENKLDENLLNTLKMSLHG